MFHILPALYSKTELVGDFDLERRTKMVVGLTK